MRNLISSHNPLRASFNFNKSSRVPCIFTSYCQESRKYYQPFLSRNTSLRYIIPYIVAQNRQRVCQLHTTKVLFNKGHAHESQTSAPRSNSSKSIKPTLSSPSSAKTATTSPDTTNAKIPLVTSLKQRLEQHENIYTLPNILTATRLIAAPIVGYLVLHDQHVAALSLFAYAGVTDLVDGFLARRMKQTSVIGSVIDPMADKLLMTVLVVCLGWNGALPVGLAAVILGRDVALSLAAFYYRYASLPKPKTLMRYFDFSLPSAHVHPTEVSKWNTFLQLVLVGVTTALPVVFGLEVMSEDTSALLMQTVKGLQIVVLGTTVWSGMSYVWLKNAVTILGDDEALKKKQGFRGRMIIGLSFSAFLVLAAYLVTKSKTRKEQQMLKEQSELKDE